jgi:3',5'-cyclic AMP phosphodiesterase CpdA
MMKKSVLPILFYFVFFSTCIIGQENSSSNPYFFIQISDIQFGMFENDKGFDQETFLYEKAVSQINKLHPDFVVITGDFVNNRKDISQISEFKRITSKINDRIPVYLVPGNHDVGNDPDKHSLSEYIQNYGYDKFSFTHHGSLFVGFNSSLIKSTNSTKLEQEQFKWLKKTLYKNNNKEIKHIILFSHIPFFIHTIDEDETYSNINIQNRKKYLSLFESTKVKIIFSGHLHKNSQTHFGQIQLITTSALGKPLGNDPSGFRIVKVFNDRIESNYYGLDSIPEAITFEQGS